MKLPLELPVEREGREIELALECSYSPETQPRYYLRNGDPGHPGDPEEFEVLSAADESGNLYKLTPEEDERAFEMAREKHADFHQSEE